MHLQPHRPVLTHLWLAIRALGVRSGPLPGYQVTKVYFFSSWN
jgi:hypothetical protein